LAEPAAVIVQGKDIGMTSGTRIAIIHAAKEVLRLRARELA
jgi:hypothetical protein